MQQALTSLSIESPETPRNDNKILGHLAEKISAWHTHPQFLRFLKETPQTKEELLHLLRLEVGNESNHLFIVRQEGEIVGHVLFHNFRPETGEIEISVRVDPDKQRCGICTQAVGESVRHLLDHSSEVKIINGWHSAWNQGTFRVNLRNHFKIKNFIPENTHLPNLNEVTDDFHWQLTRDDLLVPVDTIIHQDADQMKVLDGLEKHNLPKSRII